MFTDIDTARAPFDIDEDISFADVPERFVRDDTGELDAAWGDWLELNFDPDAW